MNLPIGQIICGDCLEVMKDFLGESINCCISSPPYWGLRDYGVDGQLGLEPTFEEYIGKLLNIYDDVKRVLTKDGTCFVNLGDTYSGGNRGYNSDGSIAVTSKKQLSNQGSFVPPMKTNIPDKSLCLIPQRFAIGMVDRGWILRNVIIWHKPNPMPSSAKDRFTVDFEYVYFFVKNKKYWFEQQYEEQTGNTHSKGNKLHPPIEDAGIGHKDWHKYTPAVELPNGRNKRTVWTIPTQPFPEAHFATYPEKLVEPMIKAGCPEEGIVLDPFCGASTTGIVAYKLKRKFIGIELNPEYVNMSNERMGKEKEKYSLLENNPCIVPEPGVKYTENTLFREQKL